MVAPRGNVVAGGEFLDHLDIGRKTSACKDAFEQIVAEQCAIGHPAGKRGLEGIDFVDALAGVRAFTDQILVHVGRGGGIRVDAIHAGKDTLKEGTLATDRQ